MLRGVARHLAHQQKRGWCSFMRTIWPYFQVGQE